MYNKFIVSGLGWADEDQNEAYADFKRKLFSSK